MPVVKMPDGTQVNFPDTMPANQIKGMIASKFPEAVPQQQSTPAQAPQAPREREMGMLLPVSWNADDGSDYSFDSNAGILGALKRTVTLPGEVMAGKVDPLSQEGIGRALEFATVATPAAPGSLAASAPVRAARPKPEGLQVAEAAQRIGVELPRAATSDKTAIQQVGKALTSVPIGGTPLRKASEKAITQLDDAARAAQHAYGSGSIERAGSMAREGMTDFATKTLKDAVSKRYDAVDELVQQNVTTPLSETAKVATDITMRRQNANIGGQSRAVRLVENALNNPNGLNYQGLKDLRTNVGELLENPSLRPAGMGEGELKRIYGALSDDLKNAVSRAGGDKASTAFEGANTFAAKVAKEREALNSVIGRQTSDEGLFAKVQAMAGSTSRADVQNLMRVKRAVSTETWDEISSAVVSGMGRKPGGNEFSPDAFLTAYRKLSDNGKKLLFGGEGREAHAKALDDIATVSTRFRQLNQFANPSGTAQHGALVAGGLGAGIDPISTIGTIAGSRAVSSVLAKPLSAEKVAKWAKAYEAATIKPGVSSRSMLEARARVLSIELANEMGAPHASRQIFDAISRVGGVPAQPEGAQNPTAEDKQTRPNNQPRVLLPNET